MPAPDGVYVHVSGQQKSEFSHDDMITLLARRAEQVRQRCLALFGDRVDIRASGDELADGGGRRG